MQLRNLFHIALVVGPVTASPYDHILFRKRQFTNTSSTGITPTSTDTTPTATPDYNCTSSYTPTADTDCGDAATKHSIQLSTTDASSPSNSTQCENVLKGYGICAESATTSTTTQASSTTVASASSAPIASSQNAVGSSDATPSKLTTTEMYSATLTYTLGIGSTARLASVVVTHSATDTITMTTPSSTLALGSGTSAATSSSSTATPSKNASNATHVDSYHTYTGNGTMAAGWPSMDQWVDFDYMFSSNTPHMKESCAQWGAVDDSDEEISNMRDAIQSVANDTDIDERFILAIVMQESTGCVRVINTQQTDHHTGLMQSRNGTGTCNNNTAAITATYNEAAGNANGTIQDPCPQSAITQMIRDGTNGSSDGTMYGLVQYMQAQNATDVSRWYRTARLYNGGDMQALHNLDETVQGESDSERSYACDIANRLTGWVNANRNFTA